MSEAHERFIWAVKLDLASLPVSRFRGNMGEKTRYIGLLGVFRFFGQTKERGKSFLAKTPSQYDFGQKSLKFRRILIFFGGGYVGMDFVKKSILGNSKAIYERVLFCGRIASAVGEICS